MREVGSVAEGGTRRPRGGGAKARLGPGDNVKHVSLFPKGNSVIPRPSQGHFRISSSVLQTIKYCITGSMMFDMTWQFCAEIATQEHKTTNQQSNVCSTWAALFIRAKR